MAKKKVNKAQAIRDTFKKLGRGARPRDVMATLAKRKIEVSSAQVSNVRASMNGVSKKKGARSNGAIGLAGLQQAKALADKLGGVQQAQTALEILAKLQ